MKDLKIFTDNIDEKAVAQIDLLLEYNDHIDIIDYKLNNLTDEAYIKHAVDYYTKQEARRAQRKDRVTYKKENRDINQLLKYKELYDAGIITKEELDAKKKEFLDKE